MQRQELRTCNEYRYEHIHTIYWDGYSDGEAYSEDVCEEKERIGMS